MFMVNFLHVYTGVFSLSSYDLAPSIWGASLIDNMLFGLFRRKLQQMIQQACPTFLHSYTTKKSLLQSAQEFVTSFRHGVSRRWLKAALHYQSGPSPPACSGSPAGCGPRWRWVWGSSRSPQTAGLPATAAHISFHPCRAPLETRHRPRDAPWVDMLAD